MARKRVKSAAEKSTRKQTASRKAPPKKTKTATTQAGSRKAGSSKKSTSKKSMSKKGTSKKSASKKSTSKKSTSKKSTSRRGGSPRTRARKRGGGKRWSAQVTERSDALDLDRDVFTWRDPRRIARSLKRAAERSERRKSSPYRSAMSMLTFYINRGGKGLGASQRRVLERAKDELRKEFGRA